MNPCIPVTLEKYKYNIVLKAGYSGRLVIEGVDSADIMTFMQFFNRLKYYDYYGGKEKVEMIVEGVDGEN